MAKPFRPSRKPQRGAAKNPLQSALDYLNAGRLDEAEFALNLALMSRPNDPDALNLLGGVAMRRGNVAEALSALQRAADAKPRDPFIHFNLAGALRQNGNLQKAVHHYDIATRLRPGYAEAEALKGEALKILGDWERAQAAYEAALKINKTSIVALNGLGQCMEKKGDFESAAAAFKAALSKVPAHDNDNRSRLLGNIGISLLQLGQIREGLTALLEAVTCAPQNDELLLLLGRSLQHVSAVPEHRSFPKLLARLFEHKDANPRKLSSAAALVLKGEPQLAEALRELSSTDTLSSDDALATLSQSPLLRSHLRNAPITDMDLERALTQARRSLAHRSRDGDLSAASAHLELVCAIARQAYLNEYVWHVTEEEDAAIAGLSGDLQSDDRWSRLALAACYRPLSSIVDVDLDRQGAPTPVTDVLRQQLDEPAEERALAAQITTLSAITDETSVAVREQYEENPYPRWVRAGEHAPKGFRQALSERLPHVRPEQLPRTETPRVLIAGCGTGLETIQVVNTFNTASVLAVDLSRASLSYGMRKHKERGIANIAYRQADILQLGELEDRFDLVHSFGVIHHMKEPEKGLAVLAGLIEPGGLLFLGLYSSLARREISRARSLIAEQQIPSTPEGIRAFRRDVMLGTAAAEFKILASPASDFWTLSECRDLMFHVEEHQYTLLEIGDMLARAGLEFIGLDVPGYDLVRFRQVHPDAADLASLQAWHAFEEQNPDTFGGTYRLWARKPG